MRIDPQQIAGPLDMKKGLDINKEPTRMISFRKVLKEHQESSPADRLSKLLSDIDSAGERLAKSKTIRDLAEYKKLVKSFIEEAVKNGLSMDDREGLGRRGRTKVYKMISEIDEKLVEVTNEVLQREQKGIDLLGSIGEVKGLLVNMLY
ncbi:YaaR family protein [Ammoniphilus sp. YIM 78166]|uniref:YaaR family protein n=1 Tax=Ammoniphilus sp. YIM 78166 TaxID=1644106 RepID=UPI00106F78B5|nr:YaaR family protein [Ammoniphilus sp. YIM 78166]